MQPLRLSKFGYRIRTRSGATVDKLLIHGRTAQEALEKLQQIYPGCSVIETWEDSQTLGAQVTSFEDIADLINR